MSTQNTQNKIAAIANALFTEYGASVTRKQCKAYEAQTGTSTAPFRRDNSRRTGRGEYSTVGGAVTVAAASPQVRVPRALRARQGAQVIAAPVAQANTVSDSSASLSFAVNQSSSAADILQRINALVLESSALARIPENNSAFVPFGEFEIIRQIIKSKQFHPVFITGLSGNGKTFQIEQACALERVEHIRVNITLETDEDDLIGGFRLKNGETVFELGPIPVAMLRGCPITIDEIDLASPKVMCLQPVLEGRPLTIKKLGITIAPKPGFTVFATANTKGRGSDDGRFVGTNLLNEAFLERFPITVEQAYPSLAVEKKILLKTYQQLGAEVTPDATTFFETLSKWAEAIRATYYEDGIEDLISTRRLVHIVKTYAIFGNQQQALALCLNRFDSTVQAKFLDFYQKLSPEVVEPVLAVEPVVEPVVEPIGWNTVIEPTLRVDADGHLVVPSATPEVI